ncbi:hypothetical protein ACJX0J_031991, partial [Zea mays]
MIFLPFLFLRYVTRTRMNMTDQYCHKNITEVWDVICDKTSQIIKLDYIILREFSIVTIIVSCNGKIASPTHFLLRDEVNEVILLSLVFRNHSKGLGFNRDTNTQT